MFTASLGQIEAQLNAMLASKSGQASDIRFADALKHKIDRTSPPTEGSASSVLLKALGASTGATPVSPNREAVLGILKKYPPTNEGIRQAMPELRRAFPGVKLLEHPERLDKLEFPDGMIVDTIMAAGSEHSFWGWIIEQYATAYITGESAATVGDTSIPLPSTKYEYEWVPSGVVDALPTLESYSPGAYRHQLAGFAHDKLNPTHVHSMNLKYIAARVFEQIDVFGPGALDQAIAELRLLGFDVTKVGDDKIDFNDGQGRIDVIANMSATPRSDRTWQWLA